MIAIYGASELEKQLSKLVEQSIVGIQLTCFSDIKLLQGNIKVDDIVITPINIINRYQYHGKLAKSEEIFIPIQKYVQIHGLNVHVSDHCNLRCKACSHSAPLVEGEIFPDVLTYRKDLLRLHELCENICSIVLLGGEPLLNPQLSEFIKISKEIYPDVGIRIMTNGILVLQMDANLIQTIKDNGAKICISAYPIIKNKIKEYESFLIENKLKYEIKFFEFFEKRLSHNACYDGRKSSRFCAECITLRDGKLKRCAMGMYITYYNKFFGTDYPTDDEINIYEKNLTGVELMHKLDNPMKICSYCSGKQAVLSFPCEQINGEATQADFIVE